MADLAVEAAQCLADANRTDELGEFLGALPPAIRSHGRVRISEARWLMAVGKPDEAQAMLEATELADLREAETVLSDAWYQAEAAKRAAAEDRELTAELIAEVKRTVALPSQVDYRIGSGQ